MKNRKSQFQLNKRLAGYSATAVALVAFTANAEGQVVYSGLKNIVVKNSKDTIDMDGDSVKDFVIRNSQSGISNVAYINILHPGNGLMGNSWVFALNNGSYIYTSWSFFNGSGFLGAATVSSYWGYFPGKGDRFIGVKFLIGTDAHAGWIRVNVSSKVDSITIVDWAYQRLSGYPITMSDTAAPVLSGVSVDNIGIDTATFHISTNKHAVLYYGVKKSTDPAPTIGEIIANTSLINSGNGSITPGDNTFQLSDLASGISYIVYAFAYDNSYDTTSITQVSFTTVDTIPPIISGISVNNIHPTTAIAHLTSNENGTAYYAIKAAADPAPTATQVKSGTGFVASGNADVNAATPHAFNITGLNAAIAYKVYMIAEDASNNLSAITHVDFSTISNVGVSDIANNNITISPNPAANVLYISMPEKSEYAIVDAVGQLIQTGKLEAGKSQVNISRLSQGIYIIHINFNNGTTFVKQIMKK